MHAEQVVRQGKSNEEISDYIMLMANIPPTKIVRIQAERLAWQDVCTGWCFEAFKNRDQSRERVSCKNPMVHFYQAS